MAKQKATSSSSYSIRGRIFDGSGAPLAKLSVRAFDQDPSGENPLGKPALTDENGAYQITYTDQDFRIGGKESGGADLIVRVFDGATLLKETSPLRNAAREVEIDIEVERPAPPQSVLTRQQQIRLNNLGAGLPNDALRSVLKEVYEAAKGDWATTLAALRQKQEFSEAALNQLSRTQTFANLVDDHAPLIAALRDQTSNNSVRDIALGYSRSEMTALIQQTGAPENTPGDTPELRSKNFDKILNTRIFHLEPTAVVQRMTSRAEESPFVDKTISAQVATFLGNQPETFNIKTTSIYEAFKAENAFKDIDPAQQEALTSQLKSLQRVVAISPRPEALPVLLQSDLNSAFLISEQPEQQFVQAMGKALEEDGEEIARQIYRTASDARIRNEQAMIAFRELAQGTGVAFIDNTLNASRERRKNARGYSMEQVKEKLQQHNLSWDFLFGDADFCACEECTSVYSPAAYFVDLLQYLRNNNLDPNATRALAINVKDPKDISGTPLEKLFYRRPDLGCLQLTCKNTHTVLPYIDLVNEVMENYIVFHRTKAFNVEEDQTSGELLAQAQHTEFDAYCILQNAVFPFTLPYHQPIDAIRIFLDYLGTSRYELMDTFRSPRKEKMEASGEGESHPPATPASNLEKMELDQWHEVYLNRAVDAEYLGLTQEEYVILTKEAFVSKTYWDKECGKEHTQEAYLKKIGVRPVHEYYGYASEAEMLDANEATKQGLSFVKDQFLRRTGVEYTYLVELLKTQSLNPNMPKGEALSIMQSIQFSYRFLQTFVDQGAGTPKGKYQKLIDFLTSSEAYIPLFNALLAPDPCNTDKIDYCLKTKDIEDWVYRYFARIGKIIVLENGVSCIDGVLVGSNFDKLLVETTIKYLVEQCSIYREIEGVKRLIGSIDKISGLITLVEGEALGSFTFIFSGNQGERGTIIEKDGQFYLVDERTKSPLSVGQIDNCNLDTVRLIHLDGSPVCIEEYDQIQRFIRLWRKLGWTIEELDNALVGLSKAADACADEPLPGTDDCGEDAGDLFEDAGNWENSAAHEGYFNESKWTVPQYAITPDFLHQLVAVKKLLYKTGLELIKLLTFWTDISVAGEKSLYQRLFLTHNLIRVDDALKADQNGNFLTVEAKISDHLPILMAAFNLSAEDISAIMADAKMADQLSLANLSLLYRYRLLAKILGLKIPDFISILPLFGNPFKNADVTLEFMERWATMEDAGFTYRQLNYLIRDYDDPKKPLAPTEKSILILAKNLYDGINSIEAAHPDIKPEDQITTDTVRAKATLLFDQSGVDSIMGIIEGSSLFITNAPKNLSSVSDKLDTKKDDPAVPVAEVLSSLRKKVKYDSTNGFIQVTGILTTAETTEINTWSNDPKWGEALQRTEKQQNKLFKIAFGIFEVEGQQSPERKIAVDAAEKTLKQGDISIAFDQLQEGQEDPNTAPQKRIAFMQVFLPYLRRELTHRFIVDTLSNLVGLERQVTDVLISEVLRIGTPPVAVFDVFQAIKESAAPASANFRGYLIPSTDAAFTFVVKNSDNAPDVRIEGLPLAFIQQEDPTNEWWSSPQKLQAGKLYQLAINGLELKHFQWKTPTSAIASIPSSQLLPDFASENTKPAFVALQKAAILVNGFNLSADEIRHLHTNKLDFGGLDFNGLTLYHWLRLEAYTRLRNSLPQTDTTILAFFQWAHQVKSATRLSARIAELTLWSKEQVDQLLAADHFNLNRLDAFFNEVNLLKLQQALSIADKIRVDIGLLFNWAKPSSNFKKTRAIAENIQKAIRAQYKQEDWEQVVKPLNDTLRENQKNALIAYLLQQPDLIKWGVIDADGLFEYFLIDVQMDACMETSRIKQAISSVQLFVQRCFLGLEEANSGISPEVLDRDRWYWMQRYRVWEANRKVFLYPENWIESNLRDDKSPFFKELESELLQKDINKQNVTDALKAYLYKVDEVANMEVIGLFIDGTRTGTTWSEGAKLHVFSRTRNAPYFFYYRYLALDQKNWYSWEKIQVDISSYDVEDINGVVTDNGSYLTPVVWNGRLLIFFPQILKKARPNTNNDSRTIEEIGRTQPSNQSKPIEFFEIKMAWSEYRNGKWTQKQLSKKSINFDSKDGLNDIQDFKLVTFVTRGFVEIFVGAKSGISEDQTSFTFKGRFNFNGSQLNTSGSIESPFIPPINDNDFNQDRGRMFSWQLLRVKEAGFIRANEDIFFGEDSSFAHLENEPPIPFNHAYTRDLLGKINTGQLDAFFEYNLSIKDAEKADAFGAFDDDNNVRTPAIFHELKRPYALYNWELFFHTPVMLADALSKAQQYEEAMNWYHYVFNPFDTGADDQRFWKFTPFKKTNSQGILDSIFTNLEPNKSNQAINEWRDNPFMPHLVARSRPVAYMKWVVMKYIDNLIAWGDYLFRQDTIETINEATQLYVLAGHILGPRPQVIPKRGTIKPQTYLSLLGKWDAFSNAMVELELAAPFSSQITTPFGASNGAVGLANIFGFSSALYFCIPNNPDLMAYWDTVADRLFKIRHCENIEGVFRKLPLFDPPIDPGLLVKAAAQGLSIASILNDLNTPMPNYRFYYLLQKALELCAEVKSLGNALLSALEKKDNETITLLRARHESVMQNLMMEVKKQQLEEAEKSLETLLHNRKTPEHRMKYYLQLTGEDIGQVPDIESDFSEIENSILGPIDIAGFQLNHFELADQISSGIAILLQGGATLAEGLAGTVALIPDVELNVQPLGLGGSAKITGGDKLHQAGSSLAKVLNFLASFAQFAGSESLKMNGYKRAVEERKFQVNIAGFEIKQIDKQITAQQIRINIANLDIANQQKLIDNAQEVEEFLKNKFTNEELFSWMRDHLKTVYYQVYSLAYELAKKAEKAFRFERGISNTNFIQAGYWDASYDGLLAGEQLYVGLKQLEAAYQEQRGYDYEITKHISLRQINPLAVLQLKESGKCEFTLPELLFDMDYPGHFRRQIKSVAISIPCVAGPYTGLNATLSLLENKLRNSAIAKDKRDYLEKTEESDPRFSSFILPITAIAASSAQSDSGMFELNFRDERYLPFEGGGAISKWRLELPSFRQFDYDTISDAVIHLRYMASEGGERLKKAAGDAVLDFIKTTEELGQQEGLFAVIDLQHDLPNEWHQAMQVKEGDTERVLSIPQVQDFLPFYVKIDKDGKPRATDKIRVTDVVVLAHTDLQASEVFVVQDGTEVPFSGGIPIGNAQSFAIRDEEIKVGDWKLVIKNTEKPIEKAMMVLRFALK